MNNHTQSAWSQQPPVEKTAAAPGEQLKPLLRYDALRGEKQIPIENIFVPIHLVGLHDDQAIRLSDPASCGTYCKDKNLFVQGDRGMGKTYFLKTIFSHLSRQKSASPLYLDLYTLKNANDVKSAVIACLGEDWLRYDTPQEAYFCFLFDNFDDLPGRLRVEFVAYLAELRATFPNSYFIVTSSTELPGQLTGDSFTALRLTGQDKAEGYSLWKQLDKAFDQNIYRQALLTVNFGKIFFEGYLDNIELLQVFYWSNAVLDVTKDPNEIERLQLEPHQKHDTLRRVRYVGDQLLIKKFKREAEGAPQEFIANHPHGYSRLPVLVPTGKDLVIHSIFAHLGDLLWHSHLPRLAKELKLCDRVLISITKCYNEFVWDHNPYVDGYCDSIEGAGMLLNLTSEDWSSLCITYDDPTVKVHGKVYYKDEINILDWLMLQLGMDDGKRFHRPEIYYQPRIHERMKGASLYDPYWRSNPRIKTNNFYKVDQYFKTNGIYLDYQMKFEGDVDLYNSLYKSIPTKHFNSFLSTRTVYDFYDVLASVGHIYCLTTGTAALADSLDVQATILTDETFTAYCPHNSRRQTYLNLETFFKR